MGDDTFLKLVAVLKPSVLNISALDKDNIFYKRIMSGEPFKTKCPRCGSREIKCKCKLKFDNDSIMSTHDTYRMLDNIRVADEEEKFIVSKYDTYEIKHIKCNNCGAEWDSIKSFTNEMLETATKKIREGMEEKILKDLFFNEEIKS